MMNSVEPIKHELSPFTRLKCGLGWDMAVEDDMDDDAKDDVENDIDLDLVALCLDDQGKLPRGKMDFIYAGHPKHDSGAIILSNDNLTGAGEGDDENMSIDLNQVPKAIAQIIFAVAIDSGADLKQDFSEVKNGFWRLCDRFSGQVLIHQSLSNPEWVGKTALLTATLNRQENGWLLTPLLETITIDHLNELLFKYSN
jgi:tellurium resistance protein TerD